jgi:cytochrome c biogenesis protein CcmG/thiol:disulfide interchange protein DsbE
MVPRDELEEARAATRRWRTATIWAAAAVAVLGIAYGLIRPSGEPTKVGAAAPEFALDRLTGGGTISSADLKGKPVIINFWASWCDPCKDEAPLLEAAWREHKDEGLTVLGVDLRDAPDSARAFVEDYGLTYPMVTDPDMELANALGIDATDVLPQTFFVDSRWRLQAVDAGDEARAEGGVVVLGEISEELLGAQIDRLLEPGR